MAKLFKSHLLDGLKLTMLAYTSCLEPDFRLVSLHNASSGYVKMAVVSSKRQSKHPKSRSVKSMRLNAGLTCLDFLNTKAFRACDAPREWLKEYQHFLIFARRTALLSELEVADLLQLANQQPEQAATVTHKARIWREAIYAVLREASLDTVLIEQQYLEALAHAALQPSESGFVWTWKTDQLDLPLWRLAIQAMELLQSPEVRQIKSCPGEHCGWVFLDAGRGLPRRWCAMDLCGNRAKIKNFRQKD